jgi:hypothetical protein
MPRRRTLTISVTPRDRDLVERELAREAVRERLRAAIARGIADVEQRGTVDGRRALAAIRSKLLRRNRRKK